jgi:hypothetical protein
MAEAHKMVTGNTNPSTIPQSSEPTVEDVIRLQMTQEDNTAAGKSNASKSGLSASGAVQKTTPNSFKSALVQPNLGNSAEVKFDTSDRSPVDKPTSPSTASTVSNFSTSSGSPRLKELSQTKASRSFPEIPDIPAIGDTMISMETEAPSKPLNANVSSSGDVTVDMRHHSQHSVALPGVALRQSGAHVVPTMTVESADKQKKMLPPSPMKNDKQFEDTTSMEDNTTTQDNAKLISNEKLPATEAPSSSSSLAQRGNMKLMDLPVTAGQKVDGVKTIKRPNTGGSWF